ncbi:MAG: hypothetical protein WA584_19040 [Pyrinomonadaceae bacterium]
MSLMICPDCGHEVSTAAAACANCGRPLIDPTIERNVVITEVPPPVREEFPKWIFIPIAVLGVVLLFVLFAWMRNSNEPTEVNVNVNSQRRTTTGNTRETTVRNEPPNQVTIPPSDTTTVTTAPPSSTTTVPQSSSVTTVPGENINADKGTVVVDAKISTKTGTVQPVRNEKFYLLDKDLEDILDDAGIDDATGGGLRNAFGLAILYPDRYGDTKQKALSAIGKHTKYSALTDSNGKASIKDIKPDSYYLFGITKTKTGFAIWSSPVVITPGQNVLNLSPASITEAE